MRAALWQEWFTISSKTGLSDVIQSESKWLDADATEDLVFWLHVWEVDSSASVPFRFETAPSKDDALFTPIIPAVDLSFFANVGSVLVLPALSQNALAPAGRWVRWRVGSTAAWSATFRIWVAGCGARM